jgi:pimeloyl-ACP methyl ester carboxylesterase
MYYEVHGTGKPLVLLHGGLLTADLCFGELLPRLAGSRQVIAVELQGHGHTEDIDRAVNCQNLASDVRALLDELGIERADLFGFSLGGLTALQFVLDYPERTDHVVLAAANYRTDGYHDEIVNYEQYPESTRMPTAEDFQQMHDAYVQVAPDPDHFEAFAAKCSGFVHSMPGWTENDLRTITAPTLLMIGDHDFVRIEHAAEMHALIPNARLAVLPDTTHVGLIRRPELVLPMLESFLPS